MSNSVKHWTLVKVPRVKTDIAAMRGLMWWIGSVILIGGGG